MPHQRVSEPRGDGTAPSGIGAGEDDRGFQWNLNYNKDDPLRHSVARFVSMYQDLEDVLTIFEKEFEKDTSNTVAS